MRSVLMAVLIVAAGLTQLPGSPALPDAPIEMGGTPLEPMTAQFRRAFGQHARVSWGRASPEFPISQSPITHPIDGMWFVLDEQLKLAGANLRRFLDENPRVTIRITSIYTATVLDPVSPDQNHGRAIIAVFQVIPVHAAPGGGSW